MDANGTRFHLLLGDADWSSCRCTRVPDAALAQCQPVTGEATAPAQWNREAGELTLRRRPFRFVAAPLDVAVAADRDRRGAAADVFGNWYWVNEGRNGIRVRSAGTDGVSDFWPTGDAVPARPEGAFGPLEDAAAQAPVAQLAGMAATTDHHLVVGTLHPPGLLVFDLFSGGPPRHLLWPGHVPFEPFDIAAGPLCGLWVLDRSNERCWILDRDFHVVRWDQGIAPAASPAAQTFQPDAGGATRKVPARVFPAGISLDSALKLPAHKAVAVEVLADGTLLVLANPASTGPAVFSRILVYRDGKLEQRLSTSAMRNEIEADSRADFSLIGHDMAFVAATRSESGALDKPLELGRLYIADAGGNQGFAFRLIEDAAGLLALEPMADYLPMRRFGGRAVVVSGGMPHYDFAEAWVPLIRQPRPRHEPRATVLTRVFDGKQPDCVWHRLLIDGCIPPDCRVRVWSRAGDDPDVLDVQPWLEEPSPYLRSDGNELPWLRAPWKLSGTAGEGTWELLLRGARGRYLRLRLDLEGNERNTPRLRALRVWYPRFSYLGEYLPAVYREDASSAAFLDGFLANLEGFWTATEDRMAAAQVLFDWRSAPADALEWLAGWFGVALDPAWDEQRRRLFIRHAMLFFQWRGTAHGLRLALSLALDRQIDESRLAAPGCLEPERFGVRIIERYLTRKLPDVLFGDPGQTQAQTVSEQDRRPWLPAQGGRALRQRYARFTGSPDGAALPEFPVMAPAGENATDWALFCESALGFTPWAAAMEQQAWREHLAATHVDADALDRTWGTRYESFDAIGLPANQPADARVLRDWIAHMRAPAPSRTPVERLAWQAFLRSRYATVGALNAEYSTAWQAFDLIPLPGRLPPDGAALEDWFQFESAVLAMRHTAHRFSVLLPMPTGPELTPQEPQRRLDLARRIVELEKPAHTLFDLRFYWAMFRVGEARLGYDTLLDEGAREQLIVPMVLGRGYLGEGYASPTTIEQRADRAILGRDRLTH
ncbi:MAG: hypothetical protein ING70_10905 [Rhodocyclaceae bacterium]|nr:hypothetical protein [Rhodocyclaceae bacterium]MCA3146155.1 hypothetical protein [Rhodocyclaceae bacterium]